MNWFYRIFLRFLPRNFRERHGTDLLDLCQDLYGLPGRFQQVRLLIRVLWEIVVTGIAIRLERARKGFCRRHLESKASGSSQARRQSRNVYDQGSRLFDGLSMDMRVAMGSMRKSPGFTLAAVLILALGIGANTTVFSALKMAILTPPPYPDVESLVVVELKRIRDGNEIGIAPWWPTPAFEIFRDSEDRLIDPVAIYRSNQVVLSDRGPATRIDIEIVAPDYFPILGVQMMFGRAFDFTESDPARLSRVTILSYAFWLGSFGGDVSVVGQEVELNGRSYEVVGVAPPGFRGLKGIAQMWLPLGAASDVIYMSNLQRTHNHMWHVVGRLRPGVRLEEAQAQMRVIGRRIDAAYPFSGDNLHYAGDVQLLMDTWRNAGARTSALLLSAAAILMLLVACANLSGLLIARYSQKSRDSAVRLAVGASRWRLVRTALVESLLLSGLGGIAGTLLACWGVKVIRTAWPRQFLDSAHNELRAVDLNALTVDTTVLGFAVLATIVTAVLVVVVPALYTSNVNVAENLKIGSGGTRRRARLPGLNAGQGMITMQIAMALVLVIGASLMTGSMRRLLEIDAGFRTERLLTFDFRVPREWSAESRAIFEEALVERIASLPGVVGVTCGCIPLRGVCSVYAMLAFEGHPEIPEGEWPHIAVSFVDDRYFDVLGIPILRGRGLDERDGNSDYPTVVLNQIAAEEFFPGVDPVGRWIQIFRVRSEVIGVAGTVLRESPDQIPMPEVYVSRRIVPGENSVLVRTAGEPEDFISAIRNELAALDPQVPLVNLATMGELATRATGDRRMIRALLTTFALFTVLLVATGTWAIVARTVVDRNREWGVRVALGAQSRQLVLPVLRQGIAAATLGLVAGLALAWTTTALLKSFLYNISPRDPWTFLGSCSLLLSVVLLASYLPARRATKINPVEVLKSV